jgi:Zn-dependent protease
MKWSLKIGSLAGIGVYVHWTFLILIGWIVFVYLKAGATVAMAIEGVAFVMAIFGCVVLHELGHALAARRFHVETRDITLLPIGGVARLERIPEEPHQELWIAVAGPAVNVVIAGGLLVILVLSNRLAPLESLTANGGAFMTKLMVVNVILVVFNMIPAFPMDGGRVLRSLLATTMDYVRATQIAATVGQVIAVGFGIIGLFFNPLLLIVALFVYLGAQQEAHAVAIRAAMRGIPVRDAMITNFRPLAPQDTLATAIEELRAGSQQDFPVLEDDQIVGMLSRDALLKALAEGGTSRLVGETMRRESLAVEDTEMLERTFQRMREANRSSMAVVRHGTLVGLLTLENVGEMMMINSALQSGQARYRVTDIFSPGRGSSHR